MTTIYELWLDRVCGLALKKKQELINRYESAEQVYGAKDQLRLDGDLEPDRKMKEYMEIHQIGSVTLQQESYPRLLREILNPPYCLYYKGSLLHLEKKTVAVVGSRKTSAYGRWAAENLARHLVGADICVVSGLAAGIDGCAHRGALQAGGVTAAVLGCGVDICYPATHDKLMEQIGKQGIVLSEFRPGTNPKSFHFPLRNRIISGLCCGVVVVEAGISSGSLITAELAGEQGREVFSIPGNINQMNSIGCNKLIQDGAIPVVTLDDIAEQLGISWDAGRKEELPTMGSDERDLYEIIKREGEISISALAMELGKATSKISGIVTILEMKGAVKTAFGKVYIAKS